MSTRYVVMATWNDVPHLTEQAKAELWASLPPHQREARSKGVPQLGSGAIYPVAEADIVCEPFQFPAWYRHAYGLDVGWNKTAAIWGALDPEDDVLYLYSEHYRGQAEPAVHISAIEARGRWIPGVIDPASRGRSQYDGRQLLHEYQIGGLDKLTEADNAVEAGINEVWMRLATGRLKVFSTLVNFLAEFRLYRRDENGKIVKKMDHLMDSARYLCRSGISKAVQRPFEQWEGRPGTPPGVGRGAAGSLTSDYHPYAEAFGAGQAPAGPSRQSWGGIGSWNR